MDSLKLNKLEDELKFLQKKFTEWQDRVIKYRQEIVEENKPLSNKEKMLFSGAVVDIDKGYEGKGFLLTKDVKSALKDFLNIIDNCQNIREELQTVLHNDAKEIFGKLLVENPF